MRLAVIVPAFNEEKTIAIILRRIAEADMAPLGVEKSVIVADDGSTDETAGIVEREFPRVILMRSGIRRGKGNAVRRALERANADYVIIQDADLEYDPCEYPRLIEPIVKGSARVVYGSRFFRRRYPDRMLFLNFIGNKIGTWLVNLLYGSRLTDLMTGYKVVPLSLMKELNLRADGFEICPEITAKLLKRKIPICEVPVSYRGRTRKEGKKISVSDGLSIVKSLLRYCLPVRPSASPGGGQAGAARSVS